MLISLTPRKSLQTGDLNKYQNIDFKELSSSVRFSCDDYCEAILRVRICGGKVRCHKIWRVACGYLCDCTPVFDEAPQRLKPVDFIRLIAAVNRCATERRAIHSGELPASVPNWETAYFLAFGWRVQIATYNHHRSSRPPSLGRLSATRSTRPRGAGTVISAAQSLMRHRSG